MCKDIKLSELSYGSCHLSNLSKSVRLTKSGFIFRYAIILRLLGHYVCVCVCVNESYLCVCGWEVCRTLDVCAVCIQVYMCVCVCVWMFNSWWVFASSACFGTPWKKSTKLSPCFQQHLTLIRYTSTHCHVPLGPRTTVSRCPYIILLL